MSEVKRKFSPVEPAWSSYIHMKGNALGLPIAGNFELTSRCNFNCKMCYVHDNSNIRELSAKEWIEIGRQAANQGMVFLLLTGGEPFLRKDFFQIYSALRNMGLLISINTNGSLLTDESIEYLKAEPPLRMNISLYGCSNETYARLCGRPDFERVSYNIKRLCEAGIQVRINASITPYNKDDIEGIYKFADELGVPIKATTYMFPPVRINGCSFGEAVHRFDSDEAAKKLLCCREQYMTPKQLADSYMQPIPISEDDCVGIEGDTMRCRGGKTAFWVTWDGRMLPCGMFPIDGYSIKEFGFSEAWEKVKDYTKTIRMPKECKSCSYKGQCFVCAASCFAECGDTSKKPDYICRVVERLNEETGRKYLSR